MSDIERGEAEFYVSSTRGINWILNKSPYQIIVLLYACPSIPTGLEESVEKVEVVRFLSPNGSPLIITVLLLQNRQLLLLVL